MQADHKLLIQMKAQSVLLKTVVIHQMEANHRTTMMVHQMMEMSSHRIGLQYGQVR